MGAASGAAPVARRPASSPSPSRSSSSPSPPIRCSTRSSSPDEPEIVRGVTAREFFRVSRRPERFGVVLTRFQRRSRAVRAAGDALSRETPRPTASARRSCPLSPFRRSSISCAHRRGRLRRRRSIEGLDQLLEAVDRRRLEKPLRRQILLARSSTARRIARTWRSLSASGSTHRRFSARSAEGKGAGAVARAPVHSGSMGSVFLFIVDFICVSFGAAVESFITQDFQIFEFTQYF